ncbi:MAG: serine/threonine protein kinase [Fimbriimonadaceae bacterium]|nr:serine/threonine protein kinase [Fimbriimonadaceae bacterium]
MNQRLQHQIGDLIGGQWQVLAELGWGSYGTVYLVADETGFRRVAKEMHLFADPLAAARGLQFHRAETAVLSQLEHPGIVASYPLDIAGPLWADPATGLECAADCPQAIELAGRYYLLQDYHPGETLAIRLARAEAANTPLPAELVTAWLRQLAESVGYLHRLGLVHRDLKPANILIREQDQVALLIDFGLCRPAQTVPGYGTVPLSSTGRFGTPGYSPPDPVEQENPGPAADQYALGITVRQALTGLDPTDPSQAAALREQRLTELRDDLDGRLAAALDRAVRPAAEDRHANLPALLAALAARPDPPRPRQRQHWVVIEPTRVEAGRLAPGQMRDLKVVVFDRRRGIRPRGYAVSGDDALLRLLPATSNGSQIELHLLLHVPREAAAGPATVPLTIHANDEEHSIVIAYEVDRDAPKAGRSGCLALPATLLGWR